MGEVSVIYTTSAWTIFALGCLLNALLIHFIRTKTKKEMRIYSRLLLFSCIMDIGMVTATALVQPIFININGYRGMMQNGIFRHLPKPQNYLANIIWLQLLLFFLISTSSQWVLRYTLLAGNGEIRPILMCKIGLAAVFLNIFHVAVVTWGEYPHDQDNYIMRQLAKNVENDTGFENGTFVTFSKGKDIPWLIHVAIMILLFTACYSVIVIYVKKIRRYVYSSLETAGAGTVAAAWAHPNAKKVAKVRTYNHEITRVFLMQAILPTIEIFALMAQIGLPIIIPQTKTNMVILYSTIPLYSIPVLNAFCTILLIKPYRKAFFFWKNQQTLHPTINT